MLNTHNATLHDVTKAALPAEGNADSAHPIVTQKVYAPANPYTLNHPKRSAQIPRAKAFSTIPKSFLPLHLNTPETASNFTILAIALHYALSAVVRLLFVRSKPSAQPSFLLPALREGKSTCQQPTRSALEELPLSRAQNERFF